MKSLLNIANQTFKKGNKQHFATVSGVIGDIFQTWRSFKNGVVQGLIEKGEADKIETLTEADFEKEFAARLSPSEKAEILSWN